MESVVLDNRCVASRYRMSERADIIVVPVFFQEVEMRIEHVAFYVLDLEATKDFFMQYCFIIEVRSSQ